MRRKLDYIIYYISYFTQKLPRYLDVRVILVKLAQPLVYVLDLRICIINQLIFIPQSINIYIIR